ncbi:MAG TPA: hypothetical protein VGF45_10330 [Polyangia bacterium]
MTTPIRVLRSLWPLLLAAAVVLLRTNYAFAAIDIGLDDGFAEAGTSIKRQIGQALTIIGLIAGCAGLGWAGWKYGHKDREANYYLLGAIAAAGTFLIAGRMLER